MTAEIIRPSRTLHRGATLDGATITRVRYAHSSAGGQGIVTRALVTLDDGTTAVVRVDY